MDWPESRLARQKSPLEPPDMEDRTSGRIGSLGFSWIRRVWVAGCGLRLGFSPRVRRNSSIAGFPGSPASPSHRSWRIGAPWTHGSTSPSYWSQLPLGISPFLPIHRILSRSLGLISLISRISLSLNLSSQSHSLPLAVSVSGKKKEEQRRENEGRKKNRRKEKKKKMSISGYILNRSGDIIFS